MKRRRFRIRRRPIDAKGRTGAWKVRDERRPYQLVSCSSFERALAFVSAVIATESAAYPERHVIIEEPTA